MSSENDGPAEKEDPPPSRESRGSRSHTRQEGHDGT